jgi:hypothetical protein
MTMSDDAAANAAELNNLVRAVLQTIIDQSPDGVNFDITATALLSVIAELAVTADRYPTPRDTRLFAERCGKGVGQMIKTIRDARAAGSHSNIVLKPSGPLN